MCNMAGTRTGCARRVHFDPHCLTVVARAQPEYRRARHRTRRQQHVWTRPNEGVTMRRRAARVAKVDSGVSRDVGTTLRAPNRARGGVIGVMTDAEISARTQPFATPIRRACSQSSGDSYSRDAETAPRWQRLDFGPNFGHPPPFWRPLPHRRTVTDRGVRNREPTFILQGPEGTGDHKTLNRVRTQAIRRPVRRYAHRARPFLRG
jgi:hypothetical protein